MKSYFLRCLTLYWRRSGPAERRPSHDQQSLRHFDRKGLEKGLTVVDQDGDIVLFDLLFDLVLPLLQQSQRSQDERRLLARVVARVENARRDRFDRLSETLRKLTRHEGQRLRRTSGSVRDRGLAISSARIPPVRKGPRRVSVHGHRNSGRRGRLHTNRTACRLLALSSKRRR